MGPGDPNFNLEVILRPSAARFDSLPASSRLFSIAGADESSVVIAVDHNACILCDRCVRGCNEIRNNQVIGRMSKGYRARIAFDLNDPMGDSTCVSCGECMVSCPTGALTNRKFVQPIVNRPRALRRYATRLLRVPASTGPRCVRRRRTG